MNVETIYDKGYVYFLDRNAWNVNDPEALIVEMTVIEEDDVIIAYANQGEDTIQFELTDDFLTEVMDKERKYLFMSRMAAQAHYDEELRKQTQTIRNMPKDELIQLFFDKWKSDSALDTEITNTMRAKIKKEFNVVL